MKTRNILLACGIAVIILIGVTAAITLLPAQSNDEQLEEYEGTDRDYLFFEQIDHITHDIELPQSLTFCGEEVPLDLFYVRERLERELMVNTYRHSATILLLKRTTRWFPVMEPIMGLSVSGSFWKAQGKNTTSKSTSKSICATALRKRLLRPANT